MSTDPDCIFCKIVAGELPSTQIAETDAALAFMDINPASEGHALVIPKVHSRDLMDIEPEDLTACALLAQQVARTAMDRLDADGVNLLNCCGADAWQTVFHFHLHVIPRFADQPEKDSLVLPWEPTPGDMDAIAATGQRLAG